MKMLSLRPTLSGSVLALLVTLISLPATANGNAAQPEQINQFVEEMVSKHTFDKASLALLLGAAQKQQRILDAIASPAEAKPWHAYRPIFVTESRIREGVEFWNSNAATLARAAEQYGVPAEIIVAIIGVETRYGRHKGGFRVIDSLATLEGHFDLVFSPGTRFSRPEF